MFRLGLTGSIGSGKSTTAGFFRKAGIPVHDADAAVHRLYAGPAAPLIETAFPGTTRDGVVDRPALSAILKAHPERFSQLEAIVHPLVRQAEVEALAQAERAGHALVVLDIPLLFETRAETRCDAILVVHVDADEQKRRVLARAGMTEALFHAILARQMSPAEKCRRAHAMIDTGFGLEAARRDVEALIRALASVRR
jgi:dephospho-CoA kinase